MNKLFHFTAAGESVFSRFHTGTKRWLCHYDEYLFKYQGLANGTRWRYLFFATRFFHWVFKGGPPNWTKLNSQTASEFVTQELARRTKGGRRLPIIATRSLLRFLASQELITAGLEKSLPRYRQYKDSMLPVHASEEQIQTMLGLCDRGTAAGLRNYAILLLLSRFGLRAQEITRLRLEDINWVEGKIRIQCAKSFRERSLPLTDDVGQALAEYVRRGRPNSSSRVLFLQNISSHNYLSTSAITAMVRRTFIRAGIKLPHMGAHVFRHTAATQMLCGGASFKQIADILGHRSIDSTAIYAKLDLHSLAAVALPWPGGVK